ncbi:uncharacterized protein L201_007853 [Kwoniella dendrophila CBS 6074]|uniref:UBC core domain-containing protein n=1 Tax=Kwoniella dendrophila CBS 6074 TaxID=1295534 RepID=A0AAX4K594_9TREE
MSDPAFVQLLDMGIPGGRAKAALRRSKGDVMSAAERVFAGEFDDIPSDDEGDDDVAQASSSTVVRKAVSKKEKEVITVVDSDEEMVDGSEDGIIESDSDVGNFADGFEDDGEIPEDKLLSDPYAGIFFSKDRVEKVIEPVEKEKYTSISIPGSVRQEVKVLGRGEWMSGCPEGNEQSFLFQLYSMLAEGHMSCSGGCGHQFQRKEEDFFLLFPDFSSYTEYLRAKIRLTCPQCNQITCLACGEKVNRSDGTASNNNPAINGNGKQTTTKMESLLHCPNLQGVLLGIGLQMIETAFSSRSDSSKLASSTSNSGSLQTQPSKKQKTGLLNTSSNKTLSLLGSGDIANGSTDPDSEDEPDWSGSGEGTKAVKGTGYAGSGKEDRTGQAKAEEAQTAVDRKTTLLLSQVRVFLPDLNRPGGARTSDHLVHPTALAHLRRRSAFVNDLLRNDSLLDMSKRADLYTTLFDWLEIISNHEALASMLAMPQMRPISMVPCPDDKQSVTVTYEGSSSPRELLENCVIQASAALKSLRSIDNSVAPRGDALMTEEDLRISKAEQARRDQNELEYQKQDANHQLRSFCERIITSAQKMDRSLVETKGKPFVDRMRESLPRIPGTGVSVEEKLIKGRTEETTIKIYEEWAAKARFHYCDLTEPSSGSSDKKVYRHAFSSSAQSLEGMNMPKRSLAIAKELAILTTSLPVAWHSTIFLRVDETRVDVLKAMIIGPEGTPYENGCFIFDIFLPLDYNQRCPNVKSMTTNGGKYRLNPNLYADGKVCLSLLGTWSGPGWISGQSTLLQVLISISSLILCEEPYTNEPGWANDAGTPSSKAYSANVRRMVLVDAMANNINSPPYPFENEIKTHFRLKARSIKQQIENWKALDDGKACASENFSLTSAGAGVSFDAAAKEMKRLLDDLERGHTSTTNDKSVREQPKQDHNKGRLAKAFGLKR